MSFWMAWIHASCHMIPRSQKERRLLPTKLKVSFIPQDPGPPDPWAPLPHGLRFPSNQPEWFQQAPFWPLHSFFFFHKLQLQACCLMKRLCSPSIALESQPSTVYFLIIVTNISCWLYPGWVSSFCWQILTMLTLWVQTSCAVWPRRA